MKTPAWCASLAPAGSKRVWPQQAVRTGVAARRAQVTLFWHLGEIPDQVHVLAWGSWVLFSQEVGGDVKLCVLEGKEYSGGS